MNLIVDDREFVVERLPELGPHTSRRLTVGDYAIMYKECLLACIERKTLEDYAASLKDGRHANREKMLEMRTKCGCRVYYIVEGKPPRDHERPVGGIPYRHILSSIDHIMYRDGISVITTDTPAETASRLCSLMANLSTLGQGMFDGLKDAPNLAEELSARREKSRTDIINEMWSCFRGISIDSAPHFAKKWALGDIVSGKVPRADIYAFRLPTRAISRPCADALCAPDKATEVRLLSAVPGISRGRAGNILAEKSLKDVLAMPVEEISLIGGKKRLGTAVVTNMLGLFNPPPQVE